MSLDNTPNSFNMLRMSSEFTEETSGNFGCRLRFPPTSTYVSIKKSTGELLRLSPTELNRSPSPSATDRSKLILEEDRWIDQYTLTYGYLPTKVLMENALGRRAISVMGRVYAKRGVLGLPREYSRWNGDAYLEFIKRNRLQDFWYREYWKEAEKERTRYKLRRLTSSEFNHSPSPSATDRSKHRVHISKAPLEDQCDEVMPPPPPLTRSPSSRKLCLL